MDTEEQSKVDLGGLGSFDFTPDWARKDAGVNVGKIRPVREDDVPAHREAGPRKDFGARKPFDKGARKGFGRREFGDRKGPRPPRPAVVEKPLDVEVKVLPESAALGTIIRKLQGDSHAYKLKDLAYFFLDNPQSVLLKITPKGEGEQEPFYQCKACGFVATKYEDIVSHVLAAHQKDYYDSKEVDCEPPKGNFTCVAKCGLSGVLLGPPNIHEFAAVVREMNRTRYPEMSEDQYRAHIEMVRDAESIEAWRQSAVKKTVFMAKGSDIEMSRDQAEGEFKRTILPSLISTPRNLMITAAVALQSPVRPLVWAVKDALELERRSPHAMIFALRGAFHHRKLNFFRANDSHGPEFVCGVAPKEFDASHAVPELAAAAKFLQDNPCCDKSEFPETPDFEKQLNWLVSTGHAIAFTNGVYSAAEKFPKYGPQWKKRGKKVEEKVEVEAEEKVEAEAEPTEPAPVEPAPLEENVVNEGVKDEAAPQLAE